MKEITDDPLDAQVVPLRPMSAPADGAKRARFLQRISFLIARGDVPMPRVLLIAWLDDEGKPHGWTGGWGGATWRELSRLAHWCSAAVSLSAYSHTKTLQEGLDERHAMHLRSKQSEAEKHAAAVIERPWECENCGRRYKQRTRCETHERTCLVTHRDHPHRCVQYLRMPLTWTCCCGHATNNQEAMASHLNEGNRPAAVTPIEIKGVPDGNED